jgi:hypothetical protein
MNASLGSNIHRSADTPSLDDVLQCQMRWVEHVVDLQTTWMTSCLALQADCWRQWTSGSVELPAWMVWHNGAEQLA